LEGAAGETLQQWRRKEKELPTTDREDDLTRKKKGQGHK